MWVLIGVLLTQESINAIPISAHTTMSACFSAREEVLQKLPTPKINYEFVCIKTDLIEGV